MTDEKGKGKSVAGIEMKSAAPPEAPGTGVNEETEEIEQIE